ncbi:type II toxin-antitoxin system RelE/ParE family toxin [Lactobacillus sp. ESL0684]|uniref:type II toxin-antitoxin system RelE/ParE family toxin n=1 Tax=unclassified Lactobacillus TaxID=2620435 RepID=UPI0023F81207|nr:MULTISPECIES: type II toxin-antitoxin system RelE/ParE family toxin [unclassified Lactobacillus]WEV40975.1 type II toxin-antitoxin system RelE/ParE family toxin [Lactobacillus sp. ESL0681]WEV44195.1 type II toxin-antitoxin system RelE/ParE family toxin [Lactobacillus sp. ESL0684]
MYDVEIYEDKCGHSEIKDWLDLLNNSSQTEDKRVLKKVRYQLKLLQALGPNIRPPQSKILKGYKYPIMELRPLPDRIFYASYDENKFILLNHYTKKQNKTDKKQIQRAINLLEDWLERQ